MIRTALTLAGMVLLAPPGLAQSDEAASATVSGPADPVPNEVRGGTIINPGNVVAGTAQNGPGGNNPVFAIDVETNTSGILATGVPIWGATYDPANDRILFTTEAGMDSSVGGAPLYQMNVPGGAVSLLGVINDGAGTDFRIDGLAVSGGTLYGTRAGGDRDGLYSIDTTTFTATLVTAYADSISGIDADPSTGTIYGVNDTTFDLVTIDPGTGTITQVAGYPEPGVEGDIDGLAVGNGFAYLVPDDNDPGSIYVYDLVAGAYVAPLTAPWGVDADTFSGAAVVPSLPDLPESQSVPTLSAAGLGLLAALFALASLIAVRSRSTG